MKYEILNVQPGPDKNQFVYFHPDIVIDKRLGAEDKLIYLTIASLEQRNESYDIETLWNHLKGQSLGRKAILRSIQKLMDFNYIREK